MTRNNFENDPGFWESVFNFGRQIFSLGQTTKEKWNENYSDYIRSSSWKTKSNAAKVRAGRRCQLCNSTKFLQTHHRTYERLGKEDPGDLIVLCDDCHKKFHGKS